MKFKTKADKNGNTHTLSIDLNTKTYTTNCMVWPDDMIISHRDMRSMIYELKECGFTERS